MARRVHLQVDMHAPKRELEEVPTANPFRVADVLESLLDAFSSDPGTRAPEFWSWQVLETLSHLSSAITTSLYRGENDGRAPREHAEETRSLLVEVHDVFDQLWFADWPAISSPLEREIRNVLMHVRESYR